MTFIQKISPNLGQKVSAGWCLKFVQDSFRAPVMHETATIAANATRLRSTSRTMPNVAVPVWFWHYGTYGGVSGEYGHVVIWVPGRGFLSSPVSGFGSLWLSSIEDVERTFLAKYRFWTRDINTLLVAEESPKNPLERKPMYFSDWIKDGHHQVIPVDGKQRLLERNKKGLRTIMTGDVLVSGTITVKVSGPAGTKIVLALCRDAGSGSSTKTSFIEEVSHVIPEDGELIMQVAAANHVPKGDRLHGRITAKGVAGGKITITRYAQKFMVWN